MSIEKEQFYGTDVDTFYVDRKGQCWLIASADWTTDRAPEKVSALPFGAVEVAGTDDWMIEAADEIES